MNVVPLWDCPEKNIIRYEFTGHWTWRTFEPAFRTAVIMTQSVCHHVDTIFDFTASRSVPENLVAYLENLLPFIPDNTGAIFIVNSGIDISPDFAELQRLYKESGKPLFVVASVQQAYSILPVVRRNVPRVESTLMPGG
jgi:hypothetical protein